MRRLWLLSLLALGGCGQTEVERAEKELQILEQTTPQDEDALCRAKQKVADAYLHAQIADKFEKAKLYADITCQSASQRRRLGI